MNPLGPWRFPWPYRERCDDLPVDQYPFLNRISRWWAWWRR